MLLICAIVFSRCNPVSKLGKNQYLLVKNTVIIEKPKQVKTSIDRVKDNYEAMSDLDEYIQQKPNTKMIGLFKFHLAAYNFATRDKKLSKRKENGQDLIKDIDTKVKKIIGEPPVLIEQRRVNKTVQQMQLYLFDKGYFNNIIKDSIAYKNYLKHDGGKARVTYTVTPGRRYTVGKISYIFEDKGIESFLKNETLNSLINIGDFYDERLLDDERNRLVKKMKNEGYFYMSKEYIRYVADTALGSQSIGLSIIIEQFKEKTESGINKRDHLRYKIDEIYIQPDFIPEQQKQKLDTVYFDNYKFLVTPGTLNSKSDRNSFIRFKTLARKVFMKEDEYFKLDNYDDTYKHLASLRIFKFINIEFKPGKSDAKITCLIQLNPTPKHSLQVEAEGTFASGDLGVAGNLSYRNKNTFKGAEYLEASVKTALESQQAFATQSESIDELGLFNTMQVEPALKLYFPRLLFPIKEEKIPKRYAPKTELYLSYNHQVRSDYTRWIWGGGMAYEWKESTQKTHILAPIYLSSVKIKDDSPILDSAFTNDFIRNSFTDHFISSSRYSFIYTSQQINKKVNFTYFRGNFEMAGNALQGINDLMGSVPDSSDGALDVFGIKYAQYVKVDIDVRNYLFINQHSTVVFRFAAGLGLPYGNSTVMPFEKNYFSGGANGIRAWKARNLGPGEYQGSINYDQIANIKLEGNIESRFEFVGPLEGAAFVDMGNIWLSDEDPERDGAKFQFNSFTSEIAIGAGLGIRLNYDYFIIRVDAAVKVKDPYRDFGSRWVRPYDSFSDIIYNLGIGYPF